MQRSISEKQMQTTDFDRAKAFGALLTKAEAYLDLPRTDKTEGERLERILRTAMVRRLDPDIYRRIWGVREILFRQPKRREQ